MLVCDMVLFAGLQHDMSHNMYLTLLRCVADANLAAIDVLLITRIGHEGRGNAEGHNEGVAACGDYEREVTMTFSRAHPLYLIYVFLKSAFQPSVSR